MGFEFLARTYRATAILTVLAALAAATGWGWAWGAAMVLGSGWSLANLRMLEMLVRARGGERRNPSPARFWALLGLKLPVLYLVGWLLLRAGLPALGLVAGFGLFFVAVTLRALGAWVVHPEWRARSGGGGPAPPPASQARRTGTGLAALVAERRRGMFVHGDRIACIDHVEARGPGLVARQFGSHNLLGADQRNGDAAARGCDGARDDRDRRRKATRKRGRRSFRISSPICAPATRARPRRAGSKFSTSGRTYCSRRSLRA